MSRFAAFLAALLVLAPSGEPRAQAPQAESASAGEAQGQGRRSGQGASSEAGRRLPANAVTQHSLDLPGRTLRFTATAGAIPLYDQQNTLQAEIGFVAYTLNGAELGQRPVTFALNGGPGAASAYLHLGVLGPWRLPLDGPTISPSASPALVPNAETWLDFTDLVFIDPVATGYSRSVVSGDDARNRFFNVESDVDYLSNVILRWLRSNDRLASPKFFIGESYGGFRGPLIAQKLQKDYGVGLNGLVLLSPVLDFGWFSQPRYAPWVHVTRLPSFAAAGIEAKGGAPSREALAEAERYASGEYLTDLMRGPRDREAVERIAARVAELTRLDPALVRRYGGRIEMGAFQRDLRRDERRIASAYDTGVTAYDPDPSAAFNRSEDPVLTAMTAPLTSAIVDHLSRTLNYRVDARYNLLNGSVNGSWRWGNGRGQPESVNELREVLALDERMRVLVTHGYTDLVTPYFASKLLIDQIPDYGPQPRISLAVYPGGHMYYSRDASRTAFRQDGLNLYTAAVRARMSGQGER